MLSRRATPEDEQLIKQIHKESKAELGSFNLWNSWTDYLKGETNYKFYVIPGKAFMRFGWSPKLKAYTIKEIGVLKEHRGKGVAANFFKAIPKPLVLYCNADNEAGNRFYDKIGMKKIGTKRSKNKAKLMNVWVL